MALVVSNFGGNYALLVFNGTAEPITIAASADVIVGATNLDIDGALNIYPASGTTIGIKNRLGSTRIVSVTLIGPTLL